METWFGDLSRIEAEEQIGNLRPEFGERGFE
jgi:hypothetical protein